MRSQESTRARPKPNLEARYGKIGISAVAAAVRYQNASATLVPEQDDATAEDKQPGDVAA